MGPRLQEQAGPVDRLRKETAMTSVVRSCCPSHPRIVHPPRGAATRRLVAKTADPRKERESRREVGYCHYLRNCVGSVTERFGVCVSRQCEFYLNELRLMSGSKKEPYFTTPWVPSNIDRLAQDAGVDVEIRPAVGTGKLRVVLVGFPNTAA